MLRGALDAANLKTVQIVAADGGFSGIAANVQSDPALKAAVSILGSVALIHSEFNLTLYLLSLAVPTILVLTVMLMQWPVGCLCGPQRITAPTMMTWEQAAGSG